MVCSEYAPLAKTGGLADAVTGVSAALCARGHDVRVLLPKYSHLPPAGTAVKPPSGKAVKFRYLELPRLPKTPLVYLLDLPELASGEIYTGDARDASRFVQLAEAALLLGETLRWQPDILHCHDWHAALVPALQEARALSPAAPTVLTLHNIGYQGVFPTSVLAEHGYADLLGVIDAGALVGGVVNFLRAGIGNATAITTVSPTYAKEICTPEHGMGLEDLLAARRNDLTGILNGVDYATWSPDRDPLLPEHYDARDLRPKHALKTALCARLGLIPDQTAPLLGVVSRLVPQKGIDLLLAVIPTLLRESRASLALLGSGEPALTEALRALAAYHPRRVSFTQAYDETLSHHILAGSDMVLVPSRYEPCGLTQLYALRYGTIPVVRATGGLADTIAHFDPVTGEGNGSVFENADPGGLLWGTRTALQWFEEPAAWSRLIANAMSADFSWHKQIKHYEAVYRRLLT
ncbi:MAG TPA: glycogen synthase [Gammaproteobacteria bacterium]|nr:glycogen synthase [Gammaproteobacteria bacterium]